MSSAGRRLANMAEKMLFVLLAVAGGWWYFSSPEVRSVWSIHVWPWYEETLGLTDPQAYSPCDLATDWAALALVYGAADEAAAKEQIPAGCPPHPLDHAGVSRLYGPLPAQFGPSNTPIIAGWSSTPHMTPEEREDRTWIAVHAPEKFSTLEFHYDHGGIRVAEMQRLVVIAEPADAFADTEIRFFWGHHFDQGLAPEARSIRARFYRHGSQAIAYLPLGRYVEWWRREAVQKVRIDTMPKSDGGRFRVVALPVRR